MHIKEMLKMLGWSLSDLRCMSDDQLTAAFCGPVRTGAFSDRDIATIEYAVRERRATRWERVKFAAKRAVRKVGTTLKTVGRKTAAATKAVGRFFGRHWVRLAWMAGVIAGFITAPVFTAIALGVITVITLALLSGIVATAAYHEHLKDNQPGMWTADTATAETGAN